MRLLAFRSYYFIYIKVLLNFTNMLDATRCPNILNKVLDMYKATIQIWNKKMEDGNHCQMPS